VLERVRERRRDRGIEGDLPLFREPPDAPASVPARARPEPPPAAPQERFADLAIEPVDPELELGPSPRAIEETEPEDDLPPQPADWSLGASDSAPGVRSVERPASGFERAQAAAYDLALLLGLSGVVLYFAAKAARVGIPGLVWAWPAVIGYLVCLSLLYAAYFTGITGHTPGKMIVVDTHGRAPGFVRALFRAALGTLGTALALIALLPMLFDPARRALHDRLFRTRVIRL
jgi:uncharacterized RDD family membrane protein YckC